MAAYKILGLKKGATPDEIKRAYRRLAMRWHPDRNAATEATERFKQIRAAYDELIATVDGPDEAKNAEETSPTPEPPDESEETVAKAADIRLNLEVSLEEAAAGCRQTIHYTRGKPCPTCDGSGEAGMARTRFCGACHGSGRLRDGQRGLVNCDACNGRGFFTERICPDCAGSGRDTASVSLEITVPAGMLPGDELRLAGQGQLGTAELAAGDLYLTLIIRSHSLYQLRGRDLHFCMPVSALAMMAGAEIEVPLLGGVLRHALVAGLPEAAELRLVGRGYPGRANMPAGDAVLSLQPVFPQHLNARQRKLLGQANAALVDDADTALPELAAWRQEHGLN